MKLACTVCGQPGVCGPTDYCLGSFIYFIYLCSDCHPISKPGVGSVFLYVDCEQRAKCATIKLCQDGASSPQLNGLTISRMRVCFSHVNVILQRCMEKKVLIELFL